MAAVIGGILEACHIMFARFAGVCRTHRRRATLTAAPTMAYHWSSARARMANTLPYRQRLSNLLWFRAE